MGLADMRGVDNDPGWINRKFRELERMIEGLRSERRTAATTIGQGGTLLVDGGDVLMLDVDGSVMFRIGVQEFGDRGVEIRREDGSEAMSVKRLYPGGFQQFRVRDRTGSEILGEEALGNGLSRPFLTPPFRPVQATPAPVNFGPWGAEMSSSSTSFTRVFRADFARQNQFVTVRARVAASDTATAGELRLTNGSGVVLGQFLAEPFTATRAAGSTDYTEVSFPFIQLLGSVADEIAVELEVRRTAGTGTLRVALGIHRGGA